MQARPTVFIVDDDPDTRESLSAILLAKGMSVKAYGSAEEFIAHFDHTQQGCLILDLYMGGMSGAELQRHLLDQGCRLPVIVISGSGDVPTAVSVLQTGAVTFLEKPFDPKRIYDEVARALEQQGVAEPEARASEDLRRRYASLTPKEIEVLDLLIEGKANKVVASELEIGLRTVEMRRASLLKKMKAKSLAELIRLALRARSGGNHQP